jgi:hypothetical protein
MGVYDKDDDAAADTVYRHGSLGNGKAHTNITLQASVCDCYKYKRLPSAMIPLLLLHEQPLLTIKCNAGPIR